MNFEDLTDEQKAKALACKTPEELIALAKKEGYVHTDEELEGIAGGWSCSYECSKDPCQTKGCVSNVWC